MTDGKKMKTPLMTLQKNGSCSVKEFEELQETMNRISVQDVLKQIDIIEYNKDKHRIWEFKLNFEDFEIIKKEFKISSKTIKNKISSEFIVKLNQVITK